MEDKLVNLNIGHCDFDTAVDEVDVLVPKYLEAIQLLEGADGFAEMPTRLQNVVVYWDRLVSLFRQLEPLERDIPFQDIMRNALQSELMTLEKVYLKINLRIEFNESQCTRSVWRAAESVLERMDAVLEALGFAENHEDRVLIVQLRNKNGGKYQKWLMSNRVLRQ